MATFVITRRYNDQYKFEFTSRKGKTIFTSNSFVLKMDCENQIDFLKSNLDCATFPKYKSSKGKYFFRLLIHDKQFAISRKYTTELLLVKGINDFLKYVTKSEILDFSGSDLVFVD